MNKLLTTMFALAVACVTVAAQAQTIKGSAENGGKKIAMCMGCHGIPNYNNAYPTYRVPRLGGQHPEYIMAALKEYRDGKRPHTTMHAQAMSLSDQDIEDIAAYLSKAPAHP